MTNQDVTIVIPQRGQADLTVQCVTSLRRIEGDLTPVVVVDDGSGDGSVERIRRANLPNCRIVEQPRWGVTAAWNTGLRNVETSTVLLLNNDVIVDGPFLGRLVDGLRTRQAMIVGVGWRRESLVPQPIRACLSTDRLLVGWCFAFGVELWQRLGGFDESMKVYYSDTDFQCRAVEQAGEVGRPAPNGVPPEPLHSAGPLPLRHLGHRTARLDPRRSVQWQVDRSTFLQKWATDPGYCRFAMSDASSAGRRRVPGR